MIEIEFIEAGKGDCFIIKYEGTNILIDGGTSDVYVYELKPALEKLDKIDLAVITHIDDDHIGGMIELFKDNDINNKIKKVFFNSGAYLGNDEIISREQPINEITENKSFKQGITLENKLLELGIWNKERITNELEELWLNKIKIHVLAPFKENILALNKSWDSEIDKIYKTRKDSCLKNGRLSSNLKDVEELLKVHENIGTTITNESSIVLLIQIESKKMLFSGDTSEKNLIKSLRNLGYSKENPIKLDLFKIPHHGSKKNISMELIEIIECEKYMISTNGASHNHPDKEVLAKIIDFNKDKNIELIFNFEAVFSGMFSKKDKETYSKFKCISEKSIQL